MRAARRERARLRAETLLPGEARERIIADVEHMAGLVGEGLDYARSARLKEERSPIEINHWLEGMVDDATDAGGCCELDDGPGLPDAFLGKAFDLFFRAESSRNRTEGGLEMSVELPRGGQPAA